MAAVDVVRESARAGRVVLSEESARDGAQAKTLMSAGFRVRPAREQGAVFGADGSRHGAQVLAHGPDPASYLQQLRTAEAG